MLKVDGVLSVEEVGLKGRNLLSQNKQVFDQEELPINFRLRKRRQRKCQTIVILLYIFPLPPSWRSCCWLKSTKHSMTIQSPPRCPQRSWSVLLFDCLIGSCFLTKPAGLTFTQRNSLESTKSVCLSDGYQSVCFAASAVWDEESLISATQRRRRRKKKKKRSVTLGLLVAEQDEGAGKATLWLLKRP